jgi:hypothetical protein
MNTVPFRSIRLCAGILLVAANMASAQTSTGVAVATAPSSTSFVRTAGEHEFTLGGSGAVNTSFDDSFGGLNFSYGWYASPTTLLTLRQSINYSNSDTEDAQYSGSTRLAYDWHFGDRGPMRPYIGVNIGGVYGERVRDTFAAGLETGVKYYVQPRTFVYFHLEYDWYFRQGTNIDDTFDDGQLNWSVGVGFNF